MPHTGYSSAIHLTLIGHPMLSILLLASIVADTGNAWSINDQTDNITEKRRMSALVLADDHDATQSKRPSLHMTCREDGGVDLSLLSSEVDFGNRVRPVYITFLGNGQVNELDVQLWKPGTWTLTYIGTDLEQIVQASTRTPTVRFEYLVDSGRQTVFYQTSGMAKAYQYLKQNCKNSSPYE